MWFKPKKESRAAEEIRRLANYFEEANVHSNIIAINKSLEEKPEFLSDTPDPIFENTQRVFSEFTRHIEILFIECKKELPSFSLLEWEDNIFHLRCIQSKIAHLLSSSNTQHFESIHLHIIKGTIADHETLEKLGISKSECLDDTARLYRCELTLLNNTQKIIEEILNHLYEIKTEIEKSLTPLEILNAEVKFLQLLVDQITNPNIDVASQTVSFSLVKESIKRQIDLFDDRNEEPFSEKRLIDLCSQLWGYVEIFFSSVQSLEPDIKKSAGENKLTLPQKLCYSFASYAKFIEAHITSASIPFLPIREKYLALYSDPITQNAYQPLEIEESTMPTLNH